MPGVCERNIDMVCALCKGKCDIYSIPQKTAALMVLSRLMTSLAMVWKPGSISSTRTYFRHAQETFFRGISGDTCDKIANL